MESWTPAVPFKAKAAYRRHIPKQRHRVTNWAEYEAGLRARGSLTVWFTPEAVATWAAAPRTTRGGQPSYSDLAITTALTLRAMFRLVLRQTEGADRLRPATARPRSPGAGPLHPEPPGRDAGGGASKGGERAGAPAGGQHGAEALRPGRVAHREARHQAASGLESAASRDGRRHQPDRRLGADRQGCRRWLPGRSPARADRGGSGVRHRRRRLRPQRRLCRGRGPSSCRSRGRATARECGAERSRRDHTDAARPASTMHRRARSHGLAESLRLQLARSRGVRYLTLEARHRRWAPFANGRATGDRGSHRSRRAEPNAGARAPGVRPHRMSRNTGRPQCAHTADP